MNFLFLEFWLISLIYKANGFVVYDCKDAEFNHTSLSLVEFPSCIPPRSNKTLTETHIQVIQPKKFTKIEYFRCLVEATHFVFKCGSYKDKFHGQALYSEVLDQDYFRCRKLVDERKISLWNVAIEIKAGDNQIRLPLTTHGEVNENGKCTPVAYLNATGD